MIAVTFTRDSHVLSQESNRGVSDETSPCLRLNEDVCVYIYNICIYTYRSSAGSCEAVV